MNGHIVILHTEILLEYFLIIFITHHPITYIIICYLLNRHLFTYIIICLSSSHLIILGIGIWYFMCVQFVVTVIILGISIQYFICVFSSLSPYFIILGISIRYFVFITIIMYTGSLDNKLLFYSVQSHLNTPRLPLNNFIPILS